MFLAPPGSGQTVSQRQSNYFKYSIEGTSDSNKKLTVLVAGKDPGYDETSKMVAEAGLLLSGVIKSSIIHHPSSTSSTSSTTLSEPLPGISLGGGFLTPATCFGYHLINRLHSAGLTFTVEEDGDDTKKE